MYSAAKKGYQIVFSVFCKARGTPASVFSEQFGWKIHLGKDDDFPLRWFSLFPFYNQRQKSTNMYETSDYPQKHRKFFINKEMILKIHLAIIAKILIHIFFQSGQRNMTMSVFFLIPFECPSGEIELTIWLPLDTSPYYTKAKMLTTYIKNNLSSQEFLSIHELDEFFFFLVLINH